MFDDGCSPPKRIISWLVAAGAAFVLAAPAPAALRNKYTFNDASVTDSGPAADGTTNGVLVDNTGIANFAGGAVNLTGNNNLSSDQNFSLPATAGAFVDLPNELLSNAVNAGTTGQASLEIWFTTQTNRNWAEVFSFGTSAGGEGAATGGGGTDYVALIPQSGATPQDFRGTTHSAAGVESPIIGSPTPLSVNAKHHVVMTFDQFDSAAGANPNGTARLYLDNGAPVAAAIQPLIDTMINNNNWLGRSQFPDPLFDGAIDEFRVYDTALTAAQVAASFTTGPDASTIPTLLVDRTTGAITIANQSPSAFKIKSYSIGSAGGGLNSATWTSIDAGNTFDPDGTWTNSSATATQLAEGVTGGTLDGGSLAASASRGIGTPWRKSRIEDLTFSFVLGDGTPGQGVVQYTGNGGLQFGRSDLNADGVVNVADWALFVPNAFTTFAADTTVAAALKGDLDGDKDNDASDFYLFKTDYIAVNGLAAFEALGAAIPEPGSLALVALATVAVARPFRRARRA